MAYFWRADDAVAAVRSLFARENWETRAPYRPVEVTVAEDDLMDRFRYEANTEFFAVQFSLDRMPEGLVCRRRMGSGSCLDARRGAGDADDADRGPTVVEDGVVMLRWRIPSR